MPFFRGIFNPGVYHGFNQRPPFFEGWYFKLVNADENKRYAIIPGVILGDHAHSFIQVLDGVAGKTAYYSFPLDAFKASKQKFEVQIAENYFSSESIYLNLENETDSISGSLQFSRVTHWPVSLFSPGVMGWYSWVPYMECYHGVLSFNHLISGYLQISGDIVDFSNGRGYIEKDWGQSFPEAWIWFQTNHFPAGQTCLTASIAIIPWLHNSFTGFIVGLWHQNQLYRFATYTGAKIENLVVKAHSIDWSIRDSKYQLTMKAQQAPGGQLLGPSKIEMGKRVEETLSAVVKVSLQANNGDRIFEEEGKYAGLEVNGDVHRLIKSIK